MIETDLNKVLNYMKQYVENKYEHDSEPTLNYKDLQMVLNYIKRLGQENKQLKKQLEYLRSREYLNQLKFERNMLEDIVSDGEISKEDKEFIDMTHRNTELIEENGQLKEQLQQRDEVIEKTTKLINSWRIKQTSYFEGLRGSIMAPKEQVDRLLDILTKYKGDNNE